MDDLSTIFFKNFTTYWAIMDASLFVITTFITTFKGFYYHVSPKGPHDRYLYRRGALPCETGLK